MKARRYKKSSKNIIIRFVSLLIIIFLSITYGLMNDDINNDIGNYERVSGLFRIHFIDVGQADCILVQSPNGKAILVDGGNNEDGDWVVSYLLERGVDKLDAIVATHPHEDHIGGLDIVLNKIPTDKVYMPNATTATRTFEEFIEAVNRSGAKKIQAKAGVKLDIEGFNGIFLAPVHAEYDNLNNYSAVLKLTHGDISFLLTGDAESLSEEHMLKNGGLSSTVLKVGHHGSSTSTSQEFLHAVSPKIGIISVGKDNEYGHPHQEVIDRLNKAGVKILRTDEKGTIVLVSDGKTIEVEK